MKASPPITMTVASLDFFAPAGHKIDRDAANAAALAADAKRQHAGMTTASQAELDREEIRLASRRDRHAANVDNGRRAITPNDKLDATVAVAESARLVAVAEARVEHIKTTLTAHRKAKP